MNTSNIIGRSKSAKGESFVQGFNPKEQKELPIKYPVATASEIEKACELAHKAFKTTVKFSGEKKAAFLETIASEIEALGDDLVQMVMSESGLPEGRVKGERGRTCNQLRMFARLVKDGNWLNPIIDEAMPDRSPMPRLDIRQTLRALGPVVVFGASNFPLAFSTAGGDTASAIAAGCPVIVKGHPSHPGTHSMISGAIQKAAIDNDMPEGIFSAVMGGIEVGEALVQDKHITAVGFTGSRRGGQAIMKLAANRPTPIPVYAEMSSINPVFLLPEKVKNHASALAAQIASSVNLGTGQFCTNPGLLIALEDDTLSGFVSELGIAFSKLNATCMLNPGIQNNYNMMIEAQQSASSLDVLAKGGINQQAEAIPGLSLIKAADFIGEARFQEEVFGPSTLLVVCQTKAEMEDVSNHFEGQLTGTVMCDNGEESNYKVLIDNLTDKVGRILFNGVPTGVEVGMAMHHGGPFPSTSNGRYTSVGTEAIYRFTRPICYQNTPDALLPDALKAANPLGLWRTVNGQRVLG